MPSRDQPIWENFELEESKNSIGIHDCVGGRKKFIRLKFTMRGTKKYCWKNSTNFSFVIKKSLKKLTYFEDVQHARGFRERKITSSNWFYTATLWMSVEMTELNRSLDNPRAHKCYSLSNAFKHPLNIFRNFGLPYAKLLPSSLLPSRYSRNCRTNTLTHGRSHSFIPTEINFSFIQV